MSEKNEALRLADELDGEFVQGRISNHTGRKAAAELRCLHQFAEDQIGRATAAEAALQMTKATHALKLAAVEAQCDALLEFARYVEAIDPGNPAPLFEKARDAIKAVEGEKT